MEMPISEMLERKLILTKAKELNKETRCLVEIDIRK